MAHGDNPNDAALAAAWDSFCDRLKGAKEIILRDGLPDSDLDRATGYQYLARYIAKAMNQQLEFADMNYPQLWTLQTPISKSFGDNPDCNYLVCWVDGAHDYRIVGNRGTVDWVSFLIQGSETDGDSIPAINNSALQTNWDGSFEITLSQTRKPGNWLTLKPGPNYVFIRQFFGEWDREEPMDIRIERIGAEGPPPLLTAQRMVEGLNSTIDWLLMDAKRWVDWVVEYDDSPNRFVSKMPSWVGDGGQKNLGRQLQFCQWRIAPDEALLIRVKPPRAAYWNFELANAWFTSVDYRYRFSSLNGRQAVREDDGSVIIAVSHADPGIPNWLDTGGHCKGMVNQRWVEADDHPVPQTELVKLTELERHLGKARRVTPAERADQLRRRRIGVDRRFKF